MSAGRARQLLDWLGSRAGPVARLHHCMPQSQHALAWPACDLAPTSLQAATKPLTFGIPVCSQGGSARQAVPWTYPPEAAPPLGVKVPALLPVRSGERSPMALAAGGGHLDAVALLKRHGACAAAADLRHAGGAAGGTG